MSDQNEISLRELEDWYYGMLEERFYSEHKRLEKYFSKSEKELAETKISLKSWTERAKEHQEEKINPKNRDIMERFIKKVIKAIEQIQIPSIHTEKITYEKSQNFIDDIKKLYKIYNNEGRKSIPRFGKAYKLELKEIDMHLRKVGKFSSKVQKFLLKKYKDGKIAENVIKKIPVIENNIERLGLGKEKLKELEKNHEEMITDLKNMEERLFELSKDPDLKSLQKYNHEEQIKTLKLRDGLKFKKAFKKLRKALERGNLPSRGIRNYDLKKYLKSPILSVLNEGPHVSELSRLLIKVRIFIEDEANPLKIKTDRREKILENIDAIVNKKSLENIIEDILNSQERQKKFKKILKKKGIDEERNELKDKIATLTIDLEHFENDLNKQKRDFQNLLKKVSIEREQLQKRILEETDEEIKLKITIPT